MNFKQMIPDLQTFKTSLRSCFINELIQQNKYRKNKNKNRNEHK